jgi:hypothetical protein
MSVFTEAELRYLTGGRQLGRIATVGADGTPHVVPVGWIYNVARDTIDVGATSWSSRRSSATSHAPGAPRSSSAAAIPVKETWPSREFPSEAGFRATVGG